MAVVSLQLPNHDYSSFVLFSWSLLGLGDLRWPFRGNHNILDHGVFPHLWINTKSFLYLLFRLSFAIWCLVWLHLCLLNDFRRRLSLHMGRKKGHCWFLPYVHLFTYYDFCNLTSIDPFTQSSCCSSGTHFFVCSAGSFHENISFSAHYL